MPRITHSLTSAELDRLNADLEAKAETAWQRGDFGFARGVRFAIAEIHIVRRNSFFKRVLRREAKAATR